MERGGIVQQSFTRFGFDTNNRSIVLLEPLWWRCVVKQGVGAGGHIHIKITNKHKVCKLSTIDGIKVVTNSIQGFRARTGWSVEYR